jgi:hypothetical protein
VELGLTGGAKVRAKSLLDDPFDDHRASPNSSAYITARGHHALPQKRPAATRVPLQVRDQFVAIGPVVQPLFGAGGPPLDLEVPQQA